MWIWVLNSYLSPAWDTAVCLDTHSTPLTHTFTHPHNTHTLT